jgi:hypothetical protein
VENWRNTISREQENDIGAKLILGPVLAPVIETEREFKSVEASSPKSDGVI